MKNIKVFGRIQNFEPIMGLESTLLGFKFKNSYGRPFFLHFDYEYGIDNVEKVLNKYQEFGSIDAIEFEFSHSFEVGNGKGIGQIEGAVDEVGEHYVVEAFKKVY